MKYTECDQCIRRCPVDQLRCENGRKRFLEVTGKEYVSGTGISQDSGALYRKKIREQRARRKKEQNEKER